jgi:hypothetical protein
MLVGVTKCPINTRYHQGSTRLHITPCAFPYDPGLRWSTFSVLVAARSVRTLAPDPNGLFQLSSFSIHLCFGLVAWHWRIYTVYAHLLCSTSYTASNIAVGWHSGLACASPINPLLENISSHLSSVLLFGYLSSHLFFGQSRLVGGRFWVFYTGVAPAFATAYIILYTLRMPTSQVIRAFRSLSIAYYFQFHLAFGRLPVGTSYRQHWMLYRW